MVSHSDICGGAARAAYRIHHALRTQGVDSQMCVDIATAGDWTVHGPTTKISKALGRVRQILGDLPNKLMRSGNPILHSPAILPSRRAKIFNELDVDLLHLQWINGEMLSIADIGKLRKPVVWTLHDMWAFCGAEHYTEACCWREGYRTDNRPSYESGFDLNRWTWNRKKKHWLRPFHIVTPSNWLAHCVKESALMHDWPVTVVPNAIDTDRWQPLPQALARQLLGLPTDVPLLLFGAVGGTSDPRKGFDLLQETLRYLRDAPQAKGLELVVFGQLAPRNPPDFGFPLHYTGHLHDDLSLQALYSAANVFVLPSRQDNLPNTGVESLACGTPVVAFDSCGLPDIVCHQQTGYLAQAFDTEDLARGVVWVLENSQSANLRKLARERAIKIFSPSVVAEQYLSVYRSTLLK